MKRNIDNLGRVVIPKEIRKQLKIVTNDLIDIVVKDNQIILTPINVINCSNCNTQMTIDSNFCSHCGHQLNG